MERRGSRCPWACRGELAQRKVPMLKAASIEDHLSAANKAACPDLMVQ